MHHTHKFHWTDWLAFVIVAVGIIGLVAAFVAMLDWEANANLATGQVLHRGPLTDYPPYLIDSQNSPPISFTTPDGRTGYLKCSVAFDPAPGNQ